MKLGKIDAHGRVRRDGAGRVGVHDDLEHVPETRLVGAPERHVVQARFLEVNLFDVLGRAALRGAIEVEHVRRHIVCTCGLTHEEFDRGEDAGDR